MQNPKLKNTKYEYSIEKLRFYLSYIYHRFLVLFETKNPKIKLFLLNSIYSFINLICLFTKNYDLIKKFNKISDIDYAETIFGKFNIKKYTTDSLIVAPSYERRDVDFLIKKVSQEILNKNKILFLDIGASFGYYSILLSNYFANDELLKIYSFEPIPSNRSLFEKNIKLNDCKNIKVFPFAIYNENDIDISMKIVEGANSQSHISLDMQNNNTELVRARTIDSLLLSEVNDIDTVFIKLDVEGYETEALIGAKNFLKLKKRVYLMVEDFLNHRVIEFLENCDATFLGKFSNYNSWWKFRT